MNLIYHVQSTTKLSSIKVTFGSVKHDWAENCRKDRNTGGWLDIIIILWVRKSARCFFCNQRQCLVSRTAFQSVLSRSRILALQFFSRKMSWNNEGFSFCEASLNLSIMSCDLVIDFSENCFGQKHFKLISIEIRNQVCRPFYKIAAILNFGGAEVF